MVIAQTQVPTSPAPEPTPVPSPDDSYFLGVALVIAAVALIAYAIYRWRT